MTNRDPEIPLLARRPCPRQRPKPPYSQRKLEILFWMIASLLTSVMMLHEFRWRIKFAALFFLACAISPSLIMFRLVSNAYRHEHDPPVMWSGRIVSVVLLVASALVYGDVTFGPPSSSTDALVFVFFPLWLLGGGAVILLVSVSVLRRRMEEHLLPGHCKECGYNLTGNVSGVCPECGTEVEAR